MQAFDYLYFLGIGGIGMSALARFFHAQGKKVAGYDLTPTPLTEALEAQGIAVTYTDKTEQLSADFQNPKKTLVVYTPAIPKTNLMYQFFTSADFQVLKRSEVLQRISASMRTLAVAGTHGKTTVSTLLAHILAQRSEGCTAFLGGIAKNYQSNLLLSAQSKDYVLEADEFDRTFLQFFPYLSVITAMDADHLDIYENVENMRAAYEQYAGQVSNILIYHAHLHFPSKTGRKDYTYSLSKRKSDFYAEDVRVKKGKFCFIMHGPEDFTLPLVCPMPGKHNLENTLAAAAAAHLLGVPDATIVQALESFEGIERRFEVMYRGKKHVLISDYAHHPAEIKAAILAARQLYPSKVITAIFQPHLFTRTRDLMDDFAAELSKLDQVFITPIYPAREQPIAGVNSTVLFKKIQNANKRLITPNNYLKHLKETLPEVLLILGAGDFVQYIPSIIELFQKNE